MATKEIINEAMDIVEVYERALLSRKYNISGFVIPELAKDMAITSIYETIRCLNELSIKNCEIDGALAIKKVNHLEKVKEQIKLL